MKNQKGMSHIMVVLLIVLIALLVGGSIYFLRIELQEKNIENMKTDMLLIQGKTEILKEESTMKKDPNLLKGTKVSEMLEDPVVKEFLEKQIITQEEYEKYYVLSSDILKEMQLEKVKIKENSYYLVNYETDEIIITSGCKNKEGQLLYKLSEIEPINEEEE